MPSIPLSILAEAVAGGGELSTWFMSTISAVVVAFLAVYQHVNTREKKTEKTQAEQLKELLELMQVMQSMQAMQPPIRPPTPTAQNPN